MVVSHRHGFQRPSIKRTEEGIATTSADIASVDEESLRSDLRELVRKTMQETLNALLDEEADEMVGAKRHERTAAREAYRSGHCKRKLVTTSGEVVLDAPKLRGATFQTAVTERYRRRETGVEEAIIEMYLAGVSTRRIEDVSGILWGAGVSAGTVSNLNEKAFESVDTRRTRPLSGSYPYLFVDGIYLKRCWGRSCENVAVMVAIGVNSEGRREIVGCAEGFTESKESRKEFLLWLRGRGLPGVRLVAGDKSLGGARDARGGLPRGEIPAARRPLLPQRARQGAEAEADEGRQDAQGRPCAGIARGVGGEGGRGGRLARVDEAVRGSQGRARGLRRDARLHRLSHAALDQDQDEQRHRAAEQGDPPPNPRRRHVPRREIRADAGDRQAEIHNRKRVGPQALPRRIAARREGGQDAGR